MKLRRDSESPGDSKIRPDSAFLADLKVRSDFPLLVNNPGLHYLDSAATSQKPRVVLDALRDFYETANANPHRGAYALSVRATECYHQSRVRVAQFLGVRDSDCLIFTRGTTEGLNLVAGAWGMANVSSDDEIVVTAMDHHANFVPWQVLAMRRGAKFRVCELTPDGKIDLDFLSGLLNKRTKIVAVSHVSNALGTINPIAEVARLVREKTDAILVCDGAQSAPHFPVSFDSLGVDFYAFSGHKMLGPMGIGGLIGKREMLEEMPPYQTGGDMIEFVHDDRTTWNVLPYKFEAGTPNAANAIGLAAAVEYLDKIGMDRVRSHERALMSAAQERLAAIEGLHVYGPPASERSGVLSFTLGDVHPHDLATILDGEGVCIRAGHHCAQPLMDRFDLDGTTRVSMAPYNDNTDIDALLTGVAHAAKTLR